MTGTQRPRIPSSSSCTVDSNCFKRLLGSRSVACFHEKVGEWLHWGFMRIRKCAGRRVYVSQQGEWRKISQSVLKMLEEVVC